MLPKKFSHRQPLYELLDKAELHVLPPPCKCERTLSN